MVQHEELVAKQEWHLTNNPLSQQEQKTVGAILSDQGWIKIKLEAKDVLLNVSCTQTTETAEKCHFGP